MKTFLLLLGFGIAASANNWIATDEKDQFTDAPYHSFILDADSALSDGVNSGVPRIQVLCSPSKMKYVTAYFISPMNVKAIRGGPAVVTLRVGPNASITGWNAIKTNMLQIGKGEMRNMVEASVIRVQFQDLLGNPQVAAFSPPPLDRSIFATCGGLFK